ncbi:AAA family ATPase [Streptomyces sp. NBC_00879]|uniref:ATP-binding protein n=1 Tax=Streptomyces sp. NBC_00879 TaxID=2975855 RepID=UPI0038634946|nr:AAA family ATPase [Streptomyces sp. NBC_00879]
MSLDQRGASRAGSGFPLVGRELELRTLQAALRRLPTVVFVEGEAGVGKSRLVAEAVGQMSSDGGRVLSGTCHPLREPMPFGPVLDALRGVTEGLTAEVGASAAVLRGWLPELAERLPSVPGVAGEGRPEGYRLVQGVRAILEAVRPGVLVVEDLQWADEATRELLLLLGRDLPQGVGLVVTYRREDLPNGTPVLGAPYQRPPGVSGAEICLEPLTEADVCDLVGVALGEGASRRLGRLLFQRSGGLPLVAEEDLITLGRRGRHGDPLAADADGDWAAVLDRREVPRGLRDAVLERVSGLGAQGVALVEAASVLAVPSSYALLRDVAGLGAESAESGLVEALQASVLCESGPDRYGFRHVLAQQVVYSDLLGPQRHHLHRQAIRALWAQPTPALVQIAHHTKALGDRKAWLLQAQAAADQALGLGDHGTAAGILRDILAEPRLESGLRSRAALGLSRIAYDRIGYSATVEALRRILADPQLSPATRGEIRLNLGLILRNQGLDMSGHREIEKAVSELEEKRPELAARGMAALAMAEDDRPVAESMEWMDRAERTIAHSTDEAARAAIRANRLTLMADIGDGGVWELLGLLPRHAEDPEIVRQTSRALFNCGMYAMRLGHDERAVALLKESAETANRAASPLLDCLTHLYLLVADWLAGRWPGLEGRFASLAADFPDMPHAQILSAWVNGGLMAARGQLAQALEGYAEVIAAWKKGHEVLWLYLGAAGSARVQLTQDDPQTAWATVSPALDILRRGGRWTWGTGLVPAAVEAALATGRRAAAEELAAEAEQGVAGRDAPAATAELYMCQGLIAQDSAPDVAVEHLDRARQMLQAMGRPYFVARATERLAVAQAGVDVEHAVSFMREAVETYTWLGATSDIARCQQALRSLGLAQPSSRGRHGYGSQLSPREREVAHLLAVGATNRDIAQALFLSPRTVEHHVAKVLKKLGAADRKAVQEALTTHDA